MKLELAKEDYRQLLNLLFIADWVLHSHVVEERPETSEYREVEQKILSRAEDFECGDCIDNTEGHCTYSTKIEDGSIMEFIEEYDEYIFWQELVSRLAERDFLMEEGLQKIRNMSRDERMQRVAKLEEKYMNEFLARGLDRLGLTGE